MKLLSRYALIFALVLFCFQSGTAQQPGSASQVVTFGIHYAHSMAFAGPTLATITLNAEEQTIEQSSSLRVSIPNSYSNKITAAAGSPQLGISLNRNSERTLLSTISTEIVRTSSKLGAHKFDYQYILDRSSSPVTPANVIFTITE